MQLKGFLRNKTDKFMKIGKKKRNSQNAKYIFIVLVTCAIYSIASLIVDYYKEKHEFIEKIEREK
jgi:uncharacterized membrane protein YwzB